MERKLSTIQKRENLNTVYAVDEQGCGGASHIYRITPNGNEYPSQEISFQHGPRNDPNSIHGILDTDLLEIVRDRLKASKVASSHAVRMPVLLLILRKP